MLLWMIVRSKALFRDERLPTPTRSGNDRQGRLTVRDWMILLALAGGPAHAGAQPAIASPSWSDSAARAGDDLLTCEALEAEANLLISKLGGQAQEMETLAAGVQEANAASTRLVERAVEQTKASQAAGASASGLAEMIPGAGLASGALSAAVTSATSLNHSKLIAEQQAAARDMQTNMQALAVQGQRLLPDAYRLQHVNNLQAKKGC